MKCMLLSEFDYHLPPELIAQQPLEDRAASRMLVVDRAGASGKIAASAIFPAIFIPAIAWC